MLVQRRHTRPAEMGTLSLCVPAGMCMRDTPERCEREGDHWSRLDSDSPPNHGDDLGRKGGRGWRPGSHEDSSAVDTLMPAAD